MRAWMLGAVLLGGCNQLLGIGDFTSSDDGDDDAIDAAPPDSAIRVPTIVPGGGVTDPGIDGQLFVHVVQQTSGDPIQGAIVSLGSPVYLTGATDATGLASFEDPAVQGPQTVSVQITGHPATTWFGVGGANVTIPSTPTDQTAIPSATVSGTMQGWDTLPDPPAGHVTALHVDGTVVFGITNPSPGSSNLCSQGAGTPPPCNWSVTIRAGTDVGVRALLIDVDSVGTPDPGDDIITPTGLWVSHYSLADGGSATGEIAMPATVTPIAVTVTSPTALPGFDTISGVPAIELAANEIVATSNTPGPTHNFLALDGPLTGGMYRFIGQSSGTGVASASYPHVAQAADFTLPPWLAPPSSIALAGSTLSFVRVAGIDYVNGHLSGPDGRWEIAVVDGVSSVELPALTPDPIGTGSITITMSAIRLSEFDPADFSLEAGRPLIEQTADRTATVTR